MITLVKFIRNKLEDAPPNNKIITKTLGKTGVLSWEHIKAPEQIPEAEEFWYVYIVKEVGAGTPRGVFLLEPLRKVELPHETSKEKGIIHMIPGTYTIEQVGNVLLLHPKILNYPDDLGPNWICSLSMKKKLMDRHRKDGHYQVNSIVVVFDKATDWLKEELPERTRRDDQDTAAGSAAPRQR